MSRLLALVLMTTLFAAEAIACICNETTVDRAFQQGDAVFAGVVLSIEDPRGDRIRALPEHEREAAQHVRPGQGWGPEWGKKVPFRVMQWWKTDAMTDTVEAWTGYSGGDCGYPIEVGKSYLVYSRRDSTNQLTFGICGRTAALICASNDLQELGEPVKTYETFDAASLVEREQPYTTYWRPCIEWPLLIGERDLNMDKHCRFTVEGTIARDGTVRGFAVISRTRVPRCPQDQQLAETVAAWRFRPAMFNGEPIETLLTSVSAREPMTEGDYAKHLKEQAEWKAKNKPK